MQIFTTIVSNTPIWVWLLLALLIWLGYSRSKPQKETTLALLGTPVAFGGIASVKLVIAGFTLAPFLGTSIGVVMGAFAAAKLYSARDVEFLDDGRFLVKGEWVSLTVFMGVFLVNYATAVIENIAPSADTVFFTQFALATALAFSSALMGGRVYIYLRAKTAGTNALITHGVEA